jgi:hypothetical protein
VYSKRSLRTGLRCFLSVDLIKFDTHVEAKALSTDYLNRFSEALMLIEMISHDSEVIEELAAWVPATYRDHFTGSQLRCAPHALKAYDALDPMSRRAFETLCTAMNKLVATVVITVREIDDPTAALPVVEVAAAAFRNLLGRATAFISSGGDMAHAAYDKVELQDVIDQLMA